MENQLCIKIKYLYVNELPLRNGQIFSLETISQDPVYSSSSRAAILSFLTQELFPP